MLQSFAGGRLFGSRSGDGSSTVVALHGWGRSHRDFDAALRSGAQGRGPLAAGGSGATGGSLPAGVPLDAIALDLPGFGASPPPTEVWGPAEYARCVADVLEELEAPVVVVGHSFGGRVAVHLAATCPGRVRALVVTGSPLLRVTAAPGLPPGYRLVRALHRVGVLGDRPMEAARERYGSTDFSAARGIMRQVLSRTVSQTDEAQLDAVACPVTLLWADDDATVPVAVAEAALARLRAGAAGDACELVVSPGAGHLLPLTAPGVLRQAIERHLR